jgi:sugar phosphate isomerase/epimerase
MKLAVVTLTQEVKTTVPVALLSGTFAERLEKAARLGYDGVELMALRPQELSPQAIREQVAALGLEVAAIASGAIAMADKLWLLASPEVSQRAVARLHALIDFAAAVGAPLVTIGGFRGRLASLPVPPGLEPKAPCGSARTGWPALPAVGRQGRLASGPGRLAGEPEDWKEAGIRGLIEILRVAAGKGAEQGVRLVLEPLNRYETDIVQNVDEGLALIESVGHPNLGLLLDTFHVNIEEPSLTDCFRRAMAAGRLWHVHLGDSNRLPPGQGHTDFAGIVAALRESGYQGYLSAELLARPDPDTAAAATIEHMRGLVNWS